MVHAALDTFGKVGCLPIKVLDATTLCSAKVTDEKRT